MSCSCCCTEAAARRLLQAGAADHDQENHLICVYRNKKVWVNYYDIQVTRDLSVYLGPILILTNIH